MFMLPVSQNCNEDQVETTTLLLNTRRKDEAIAYRTTGMRKAKVKLLSSCSFSVSLSLSLSLFVCVSVNHIQTSLGNSVTFKSSERVTCFLRAQRCKACLRHFYDTLGYNLSCELKRASFLSEKQVLFRYPFFIHHLSFLKSIHDTVSVMATFGCCCNATISNCLKH